MNYLKSKVYEFVGQASMCWKHVDKAGVFDTEKAKKVSEELYEFIKGYMNESKKSYCRCGAQIGTDVFGTKGCSNCGY